MPRHIITSGGKTMALRRSLMRIISAVSLIGLAVFGAGISPAAAATSSTLNVTITTSSPQAQLPAPGSCAAGAANQYYQAITFQTHGVGNISLAFALKTDVAVTATLYQGAFLDFAPGANCYILAKNVPAGSTGVTMNTGYNNSGLPAFPDQTWVVVFSTASPGAGVHASGTLTTNLGTVDPAPVVPVSITTASLPPAQVGVAYSATVIASGGTAPYSYTLSGGSLPAGLTLSSAGVISGTPTAAGAFAPTITATDTLSAIGSKALPLTVNAPTLTMLPPTGVFSGVAGTPFSFSFTATGGTALYASSLTLLSGNLPAGLVVTASGISGTPTAAGSATFAAKSTDSSTGTGAPFSVTTIYTVTIAAPTLAITPTTLMPMTYGAAFSQTLTTSGGAAPYTYVFSNGPLPAGLTLTGAGILSGTPTHSRSYSFSVTSTDTNGFSVQRNYTGTVASPTLTLTPPTLPAPVYDQPYSQALAVSGGGIAPYTYAVTSGALPTGLALDGSTGVISGTTHSPGTFTFVVQATDAYGMSANTAYSVTVLAPQIVVISLISPLGWVQVPYPQLGQEFSVTGGAGPYTLSVSSGTLPPGLSMDPSGQISGTPTAAGVFPIIVRATDAFGSTGDGNATVFVDPPQFTLTPPTIPAAQVGNPYSQQLQASGGLGPWHFAVQQGSLPAGLTLSDSGLISGTPTTWGLFSFILGVTDSSLAPGPYAGTSLPYLLVVVPAPLTIGPAMLPAPMPGAAYTATLAAQGGVAPYGYSISTGHLPTGLSLNAATGEITGTATMVGAFSFTVTVTSDDGQTASQDYTLTVPSAALSQIGSLPAGQVGTAYHGQLNIQGGTGPYTFSQQAVPQGGSGTSIVVALTGVGLPAGLNLAANGTLTGTPTTAGDYTFQVVVTDAYGSTARLTVPLSIAAAPPVLNPRAPSVLAPAGVTVNPVVADGSPVLAETGIASIAPLLWTVGLLLAAGLALLTVARLRRRH
ncbi:beta strand repeat-containing protein [Psychromicrobium xiongbiense]|uniref:beta strand repeat-containing protein n=1 Tax=Psychromicrobium xiongbiense TaxID=3051184 RepID=UPI002557C5D4|nr:Ig domain-containing protein [Psychromicrobium sp. YIM S02556]